MCAIRNVQPLLGDNACHRWRFVEGPKEVGEGGRDEQVGREGGRERRREGGRTTREGRESRCYTKRHFHVAQISWAQHHSVGAAPVRQWVASVSGEFHDVPPLSAPRCRPPTVGPSCLHKATEPSPPPLAPGAPAGMRGFEFKQLFARQFGAAELHQACNAGGGTVSTALCAMSEWCQGRRSGPTVPPYHHSLFKAVIMRSNGACVVQRTLGD